MSKVSIGTDPEAFLFDNTTNKIIPACGLIGGTKLKPLHYNKGLQKGFTIQEDNVMVEFNIPPAFNLDQWASYISTAVEGVRQYIATKGPYSMKFASTHKFPNKDMQSDQAMQFGCSPDFNAYANGDPFAPIDPATLKEKGGSYRFSGGHIHLGFTSEAPHFVAAAFADYYIGLSSVGYDAQEKRRNLYGQPGRYRPTSYGIEYRTPSNYWLKESGYTWNIGSAAFGVCNYLTNTPINSIRKAYQKIPWGAVRKAIIDQDLSLASNIQMYVQNENLIPGVNDL